MDDSNSGKVLTVAGFVSPESLGVVLPHEYCLVDFSKLLKQHTEYRAQRDISDVKFSLQNLGKIRRFPYSVKENLVLDSVEDCIAELKLYKEAGGTTLCDIAPKDYRINPRLLPELSRESGVTIVAGTAYYVDPFLTKVRSMSIEEIASSLVSEVMTGIEGTGGVRCGIIGEMGCSYPLTPDEEKCIKAAALAQQRTGAPLVIHPGRDQKSPFKILDILENYGADISHTVMAHLDRTFFDNDLLLRFAKRGCYLEYDLFGIECSHFQSCAQTDFPSDAQKIEKVKLLVANGHAERVLISQAVHTKHRLVKYGGHGYGHILEHIVPKMRDRGISEEHIKLIIQDNPQRFLAFK